MYLDIKKLILPIALLAISGCTQPQQLGVNAFPSKLNRKSLNSSSMLSIINNFRATNKICRGATRPLIWDKNLENVAIEHSMDMAVHQKLTHIGSNTNFDATAMKFKLNHGSSAVERVAYSGYHTYPKMPMAENITSNSSKDEKESLLRALKAFASDAPHCKILIDPRYSDIGAAYAVGKDGKKYWTFDFAAPPKTQ